MSDAPPIDALASDPATPLRKLSAVVEYDGAGFSGWQTQADRRTVQQTLESALSEMCEEPIRVRAASRTDAGVHARGQVVVFRTHRHNIPRHGFERGLNARLPDDVAVRRVTDVEDTWDPRGQARGKQYRYSLWNDRVPTAHKSHSADELPRTALKKPRSHATHAPVDGLWYNPMSQSVVAAALARAWGCRGGAD